MNSESTVDCTLAFKGCRYDFSTHQGVKGIASLDNDFLDYLAKQDCSLKSKLVAYRRSGSNAFSRVEISELLMEVARHLELYLGEFFSISPDLDDLTKKYQQESHVGRANNTFFKRKLKRLDVSKITSFADLQSWLSHAFEAASINDADSDLELAVARLANKILESGTKEDSEKLAQWLYHASQTEPYRKWDLFRNQQSLQYDQLIPLVSVSNDTTRKQLDSSKLRQRIGFSLTDPRMSRRAVGVEAEYCVFCHDHEGDFCSHGFPVAKKSPELGLKLNPIGVTLTGCPLEEKISEMQLLVKQGYCLAALAVIMIDNPMVPATGHRICNDCMKACIYQKKEPVNIPQIETRVLCDVLELPWGVEIYDLLCRWNPMRRRQYRMVENNERKVLISGLGPAGFTMAHHLTMEGCTVVAIDGLKIEPLPEQWLTKPIKDYQEITQSLEDRMVYGFGGVAEYGITVRWDKNFLTLLYLVLMRRRNFQLFGGVRLGGTLRVEDGWELGFDHICIAHGAGLPKVLNLKNSLARGMRQASDFLMALQLTGAAKSDSLANLQLRMPVVVIGGGLTAIDAATEAQAYYVAQIKKIFHRYRELSHHHDEEALLMGLSEENRLLLQELINDGINFEAEDRRAVAENRSVDYIGLLHSLGGVTIAYRGLMRNSPAYKSNHEELEKALQEGIYYAENLTPVEFELDAYDDIQAILMHRLDDDGRIVDKVRLPARTVLIAAGTKPNAIYAQEHPGSIEIAGDHFIPFELDGKGRLVKANRVTHCKEEGFGAFTSYKYQTKRVSFLGDAHPVFNGNVVKAIASATRSYPKIMEHLYSMPCDEISEKTKNFQQRMSETFQSTVVKIDNSHPLVTEMWVRSQSAARNFQPGQFFRLQNYEHSAPIESGTRLRIPLYTVSGAGIRNDVIRLFLLRWGEAAKISDLIKEGDPICLMGPSGQATRLQRGSTVMVVAGTWGAAVLLSMADYLRQNENRVLYFAAYERAENVYCKEELEQLADVIVWVVNTGSLIKTKRAQDFTTLNKDMLDTISRYQKGLLGGSGNAKIDLCDVDEILVLGSTGLLFAMQQALSGEIGDCFHEKVITQCTVGSPMQCMLKGVCGQCLQWLKDPQTDKQTETVFICAKQDQRLESVDISNLAARQTQNRMSEHITSLWVEQIIKNHGETR